MSAIELEQLFLGGLLHRPTMLASLDAKATDFLSAAHRDIFSQMQKIFAEKKTFALSDFVLWAQGRTFAGDHDGVDYLQALSDHTFQPDLEDIARQLREFARRRKISDAVKKAQVIVDESGSTEAVSYLMAELTESADDSRVKSSAEIYDEIAASLSRPRDCFKTGLEKLDAAMGGGLYAGYTYGLCGAEKAGKTTLAHTISHGLAANGVKHLYLAMEMGAHQIEARNLARDMRINSLRLLDNPRGVLKRLETVRPRENIYYADAPGATVDEILNTVGMTAVRRGITGFIVDYWQLVGGQQKGQTEESHLRHVAQAMANYGRRHGLWCILLAQMNREGNLFGGNGLRKACDQLYMIETCGEYSEYGRWLRMDASRYTFKGDIGSEQLPSLMLNTSEGPYFIET